MELPCVGEGVLADLGIDTTVTEFLVTSSGSIMNSAEDDESPVS